MPDTAADLAEIAETSAWLALILEVQHGIRLPDKARITRAEAYAEIETVRRLFENHFDDTSDPIDNPAASARQANGRLPSQYRGRRHG